MKKKILLTSIFIGFVSLCNINKINSDANFIEYIQKIFNIKRDILIAEPKPNEDYIRLDWDFDNSQPYTYKAYKKNNNEEFQTISMIDLDKDKQIKVLNVYPTKHVNVKIEPFTTWDGEYIDNLPVSASLKEWMEKPNNHHEKGYGLGLIEVEPVSLTDFNLNPEVYLKDFNTNEWIYDVVMFGSCDTNASEFINDEAYNILRQFIDDGKGLLLGHDTITQWLGKFNKFLEFSDDAKIYASPFKNVGSSNPSDKWEIPWIGSRKVKVYKKGPLTNYPWDIKDIELNIPFTHTNSQFAYGDIWLKFIDVEADMTSNVPVGDEINQYNNTEGSNNFYLSTNNNLAVIQTGHSILRREPPTSDEQKILANTIFYLSQLSTDNYLNDMSGQDIDAPEKPVVFNSTIDIENNKFIFNLEEIDDVGTKYSYYVEATGQNDGEVKTSNIAETEIKSGFKGYSYIIDTNTDTEPDNEVDTSNNTIEFNFNKPTSNKYYLHIKSIDNVGNFSETVHYEIGDTESPTLELTTSNTDITNGEVPVMINSEDNTKVDYILLPNNQKVYSNSFIYSILEDGEYRFRVYDIFGNFTEKSITINNIDKEKPSVTVDKSNTDWTNEGVQININTRD